MKRYISICVILLNILCYSQEDSFIYNKDRVNCGSNVVQEVAPFDYTATGGSLHSWSKVLYPKAHVSNSNDKKILKGLAFFTGDCASDCAFKIANHQKIYIKEVDIDEFKVDEVETIPGYGSRQYSYEPNPEKEGYQLVFDGEIRWKRSMDLKKSRVVIEFDKGFMYSGTKNLLIYYLNESEELIRTNVTGCHIAPKYYSYREFDKRRVACGVFDKGTLRDSKYRKRGSNLEDKPYVPITEFIYGDFVYDQISEKKSSISVSNSMIKADGLDFTVITLTLKYDNGKQVPTGNNAVEIEVTKGVKGTIVDHKDGTYTMYLTSTKEQGDAIIRAKVDGKYLINEDGTKQEVVVNFTSNETDDQGEDKEDLPKDITKALKINKGFSPNNDGKNDFWEIIEDIDVYFPKNTLRVFDNAGRLVYKASPYKNDWNGVPNCGSFLSKDKVLNVGAYFYVLELGQKTYKGWVYINY